MCCNCYVLQPRVDSNTPGIRVSILETHTQYPTLRHETWQLTTCPCHFEMKKWRPKSPQSRKWRQTSFVPLQKTIALRVHSEKMKVSSETSSQKKKTFCENSQHSPALKSSYQQPTRFCISGSGGNAGGTLPMSNIYIRIIRKRMGKLTSHIYLHLLVDYYYVLSGWKHRRKWIRSYRACIISDMYRKMKMQKAMLHIK